MSYLAGKLWENGFACSLLSAVFCQTNLDLEELTAVTFPLYTTVKDLRKIKLSYIFQRLSCSSVWLDTCEKTNRQDVGFHRFAEYLTTHRAEQDVLPQHGERLCFRVTMAA